MQMQIGMSLVITFGDITAPNPDGLRFTDDKYTYSFNASSSGRRGALQQLDGAVTVPITSILGANIPIVAPATSNTTRDPLSRTVTVTPGTIYAGEEDVVVTIVFTAPGPMYGADSMLSVVILPDLNSNQQQTRQMSV